MLKVHFLNVGHGDCTIIEPPSGRLTMVDINNSQEFDAATRISQLAQELEGLRPLGGLPTLMDGALGSAIFGGVMGRDTIDRPSAPQTRPQPTDPVAYMRRMFPGRRLWRFVLTHPDLDHMRGLARLDQEIGFENFWDTDNQKEDPSFWTNADLKDWNFYQALRKTDRCRTFMRTHSAFAFNRDEWGLPGGDNIQILSPTPAIVAECNRRQAFNDISIVLRVTHAGRSVLLAGDAEKPAWDEMVGVYGAGLKSDILKASHHGRDSGYHMEAVRHVAPALAILSVGGRPETDASAKYRRFAGKVATTRRHGDIQVHLHDDGGMYWHPERNLQPEAAPCPSTTGTT